MTLLPQNPAIGTLLFQGFDVAGQGYLDFDDFTVGCAVVLQGSLAQRGKFLFQCFDQHKRDKVKREVLESWWPMLAGREGNGSSRDAINHVTDVWNALDPASEGHLTAQDFQQWMHDESVNNSPLLSWLDKVREVFREYSELHALLQRVAHTSGDEDSLQFSPKELASIYEAYERKRSASPHGVFDAAVLASLFQGRLPVSLLRALCRYLDPQRSGVIGRANLVTFLTACCIGS